MSCKYSLFLQLYCIKVLNLFHAKSGTYPKTPQFAHHTGTVGNNFNFFKRTRSHWRVTDLETFFSKKFDVLPSEPWLLFWKTDFYIKFRMTSGIAKYALCHHEGTEPARWPSCAFQMKCEKIECLHNLEIPKLHLPKKYKMERANLTIEGICAYCNP